MKLFNGLKANVLLVIKFVFIKFNLVLHVHAPAYACCHVLFIFPSGPPQNQPPDLARVKDRNSVLLGSSGCLNALIQSFRR